MFEMAGRCAVDRRYPFYDTLEGSCRCLKLIEQLLKVSGQPLDLSGQMQIALPHFQTASELSTVLRGQHPTMQLADITILSSLNTGRFYCSKGHGHSTNLQHRMAHFDKGCHVTSYNAKSAKATHGYACGRAE